jgi:hypothetical protein
MDEPTLVVADVVLALAVDFLNGFNFVSTFGFGTAVAKTVGDNTFLGLPLFGLPCSRPPVPAAQPLSASLPAQATR